jgi:hypothetical protein
MTGGEGTFTGTRDNGKVAPKAGISAQWWINCHNLTV